MGGWLGGGIGCVIICGDFHHSNCNFFFYFRTPSVCPLMVHAYHIAGQPHPVTNQWQSKVHLYRYSVGTSMLKLDMSSVRIS